MTRGEKITLHALDAIGVLEPVSAGELEAELEARLSAAGLMPPEKVRGPFVRRDLLGTFGRAGWVHSFFAPEDVDALRRPRPGSERVWELTDAGGLELDRLGRLAEAL
jgi:hypothetical protein